MFATAFLAASSAGATINPFMPPSPLEGEARAYNELIQTLTKTGDQSRILRSLNIARDLTAGPTKLRAYIDCMRVGPLGATGDMPSALVAADECVANFPDHPFPKFARSMVRMHSFDNADLLTAGADEMVAIFSEYPDLYQVVKFEEFAPALRGLTASGDLKRRSAIVKAYFNPLYVPPPTFRSSDSLISGIGVLLESGEVASASRLAGFLQDDTDVIGLLSFIPAKSIWPALEVRHAMGYEATHQTWALLEKNITEFSAEKVQLLTAMNEWERLESESQMALSTWDGKDGDADIISIINSAATSFWQAGLHEQSLKLSLAVIEKAGDDTNGLVANTAFNAGYRMITTDRADEGRNLIGKYIQKMEQDSSRIEWQSGTAFLDAMRVCALTGAKANQALSSLESSKGDLFSQKKVAYTCRGDSQTLSGLLSDRLSNGSMTDRMRLTNEISFTLRDKSSRSSNTEKAALALEPLKSSVAKYIRVFPTEK